MFRKLKIFNSSGVIYLTVFMFMSLGIVLGGFNICKLYAAKLSKCNCDWDPKDIIPEEYKCEKFIGTSTPQTINECILKGKGMVCMFDNPRENTFTCCVHCGNNKK
jgi:hypothetical protein